MGMLKVAASASFVLALSSLQAESAKPVGFEGEVPEKTFVNAGMSVLSYDFAAKGAQPPLAMRQGMSDRKLGIACSWTLTPLKDDIRMTASEQVCTRRGEPENWKRVSPDDDEPVLGSAGVSVEFDVYGNKSIVAQFSVSANLGSPYTRYYSRIWKDDTKEVCLVSGLALGRAGIAQIDHGCFQMNPQEFVIKRAISSTKPSMAV